MEQIDIQKDSQQTTQLTSPAQEFDTPKTFPTPAHPLPKYLSKRAAIILLSIIFLYLGFLSAKDFFSILSTQKQNHSTKVTKISPKPTIQTISTKNWKTYHNDRYAFSLKYPSEWTYDEDYTQGLTVNFDIPGHTISAGNGKTRLMGLVRLDVSSISATLNQDYIKNHFSSATTIKKMSTGSVTVYEVHHKSCPTNTNCIDLLFQGNGTLFTMHYTVDLGKDNDKNLPILYQMIGTFIPSSYQKAETVSQTPKESCPCWDEENKTCLAQSACQ